MYHVGMDHKCDRWTDRQTDSLMPCFTTLHGHKIDKSKIKTYNHYFIVIKYNRDITHHCVTSFNCAKHNRQFSKSIASQQQQHFTTEVLALK